MLETIADRQKYKNEKLYWCLIDLKKAFDSVNKNQLYQTLEETRWNRETIYMLA